MKKFAFGMVIFLLAFANGVFAADQAGLTGFSLSAAYDGSHLSYEETDVFGAFMDQDTGWMNGLDLMASYRSGNFFIKGKFKYSETNDAEYKGFVVNFLTNATTPYQASTRERVYQYEGDFGYLRKLPASTLSLYTGIGYRDWERGENASPDYLETYTWYYITAGVSYTAYLGRWSLGADGSVQFPFDMKMKTDLAGMIDKATFDLKSNPGYRLEFPVRYDIINPYLTAKQARVFMSLTPYYQHWEIGHSDPVVVTSGGVPVDVFYEPDSTTDIFGFMLGIGVDL